MGRLADLLDGEADEARLDEALALWRDMPFTEPKFENAKVVERPDESGGAQQVACPVPAR